LGREDEQFKIERLIMTKEQLQERFDRTSKARAAIVADLKIRAKNGDTTVFALQQSDAHRWHKQQDNYYSGAGKMPCPICGVGTLRYSRSSYNGHVHAQCSTETCVSWME
jgi:hypothetical protein